MHINTRVLASVSAVQLLCVCASVYGVHVPGLSHHLPCDQRHSLFHCHVCAFTMYLHIRFSHHQFNVAYHDTHAHDRHSGPIVLLLHGLQLPSTNFAPMVKPLLDQGFRVVAPIFPTIGHNIFKVRVYYVDTIVGICDVYISCLCLGNWNLICKAFMDRLLDVLRTSFPLTTAPPFLLQILAFSLTLWR